MGEHEETCIAVRIYQKNGMWGAAFCNCVVAKDKRERESYGCHCGHPGSGCICYD